MGPSSARCRRSEQGKNILEFFRLNAWKPASNLSRSEWQAREAAISRDLHRSTGEMLIRGSCPTNADSRRTSKAPTEASHLQPEAPTVSLPPFLVILPRFEYLMLPHHPLNKRAVNSNRDLHKVAPCRYSEVTGLRKEREV